MQENDPLAKDYDFDQIAIDSVREKDRRESVTALSGAFDRLDPRMLEPHQDIVDMVSAVMFLGSRKDTNVNSVALGEAYDEFTSQSGVEVESRILRINTAENHRHPFDLYSGFPVQHAGGGELFGRGRMLVVDEIFLLAAIAKGQGTIRQSNVKYGAVKKSAGVTEFFKFSWMSEVDQEDLPLSASALLASGYLPEEVAQRILMAVRVGPVEEKALIAEFAKATKNMSEQADKRDAEAQQRRAHLEHTLKLNPRSLELLDKQFGKLILPTVPRAPEGGSGDISFLIGQSAEETVADDAAVSHPEDSPPESKN